MCAATDSGVAADVNSSGSTVNPSSSISTSTPPPRGLLVHWPPHSAVFAACHVGPGGQPRRSAAAAITAVSVARPAMITFAPASSASMNGSAPSRPTMCSQRSISLVA